ncbi:MAG: hypothetical protein ACOH2D_06805 [Gelidibacter sp.]
MKKFISKYIIFILPLIGLLSGDIFLSVDAFSYRPWEALLFQSNKNMFFYPNQILDIQSVGDLCYRTQFAIKKDELWITDELGYRNNIFIKEADILLIGDSFVVGSSIPQDSTMTNSLKEKLDKHVYNIAPAEFVDFIELLNQGIIKKPKIVIYALVERSNPKTINISTEERFAENVSTFTVFKDKVERLYSLEYLKARVSGKQGKGIKGEMDSRMFFLNGKKQKYHYDKISDIAKTIQSYKEYCDSIGVDFIFLPLPNKETVYFDEIALEAQPDYLIKLDSVLIENKIGTVNTLGLFNNFRKSNSDIIYHLDDTHWNGRGIELVAEKLTEYIRTNRK